MKTDYEARETGCAGNVGVIIILLILLCSCSEYVNWDQEIKPDTIAHPDTTNKRLKEIPKNLEQPNHEK